MPIPTRRTRDLISSSSQAEDHFVDPREITGVIAQTDSIVCQDRAVGPDLRHLVTTLVCVRPISMIRHEPSLQELATMGGNGATQASSRLYQTAPGRGVPIVENNPVQLTESNEFPSPLPLYFDPRINLATSPISIICAPISRISLCWSIPLCDHPPNELRHPPPGRSPRHGGHSWRNSFSIDRPGFPHAFEP